MIIDTSRDDILNAPLFCDSINEISLPNNARNLSSWVKIVLIPLAIGGQILATLASNVASAKTQLKHAQWTCSMTRVRPLMTMLISGIIVTVKSGAVNESLMSLNSLLSRPTSRSQELVIGDRSIVQVCKSVRTESKM